MLAKAFGICGVRAPDAWSRSRSCQSFFTDDDVDVPLARVPQTPSSASSSAVRSVRGSARVAKTPRSESSSSLRGSSLHPLSLAQQTPRTPGSGRNVRRLSAFSNCPSMSEAESTSSGSCGASYIEELGLCREGIANALRSNSGAIAEDRDAELALHIEKVLGCMEVAQLPLARSSRAGRSHRKVKRMPLRAGRTGDVNGQGASPTTTGDAGVHISLHDSVSLGSGLVDDRYTQGKIKARIHDIRQLMHWRGQAPPEPRLNDTCAHFLRWDACEKARVGQEVAQEVREYQAMMSGKFSRLGFNTLPVQPAELDPARAVREVVANYHENCMHEGVYWPGLDAAIAAGEGGLTTQNRKELTSYLKELRGDNLCQLWPSSTSVERHRAQV